MDYYGKLKEVLVSAGLDDVDDITAETSLVSDLDMDSFMVMDAVTMLESAFGVSIPDRDLRKLNTVGDIVAYLKEKLD